MDIKNPEEREAMIEDYTATVKRLQQRYEDEKTGNLTLQRNLEEQYRPIVKSQENMTDKVSQALLPIREGILNMHQGMLDKQPIKKLSRNLKTMVLNYKDL